MTASVLAPTDVRHRLRDDDRGVYAPFIAVIAAALLFFSGIAYDAPRLITARQHADHKASEVARMAAAIIIAGGSIKDAEDAVKRYVAKTQLIYGFKIYVGSVECVGSNVEVTLISGYIYRSALGIARQVESIAAVAAAEARIVDISGAPTGLWHAGACSSP